MNRDSEARYTNYPIAKYFFELGLKMKGGYDE